MLRDLFPIIQGTVAVLTLMDETGMVANILVVSAAVPLLVSGHDVALPLQKIKPLSVTNWEPWLSQSFQTFVPTLQV